MKHLENLMGGYFHQDWTLLASSSDEVLEKYRYLAHCRQKGCSCKEYQEQEASPRKSKTEKD